MRSLYKTSLASCVDRSGNVAIMAALFTAVLIAAVGIAIDFSRAYSVKSNLQGAVDAGVLAASILGGDYTTAEERARAVFDANAIELKDAKLLKVDFEVDEKGAFGEASASVPATLTRILGFNELNVHTKARALASQSGEMEIALVLDVTGSMRNDMQALKDAAKGLVKEVYSSPGGSSNIKMAVVPYVGAVNIGNGRTQMQWMDVNGNAAGNGITLENYVAGYEIGCTIAPSTRGGTGGGGPGDPGPGGNDRRTNNQLDQTLPKYSSIVDFFFGIGLAHAGSTNSNISPYVSRTNDCIIGRH